MIPELGQLCLALALLMSFVQAVVPLLQRLQPSHNIQHLTSAAATGTFLLSASAFAALIYSYAVSDFSVLTVIENSHSQKPLLYKLVGAWGNHEGSMLLWLTILSGCGLLVALPSCRDRALKAATLATLGFISAGLIAYILFTSNPFLRVFPAPLEGEDLNPILQDIGLSFHPPLLYAGYVGFGLVFAYAVAGMLLKRLDREWAETVHPWIMLPWLLLTLGIGAGSWWAYRELGWGGWWFWDPVENVALLPWLTATALLHSNLALKRRGDFARWVALLSILTFTLSLVGTFIVRSGLITSVHAFASDPLRGLFILAYIVMVSGAALLVYAFAPFTRTETSPTLLSRSGLILINNLLLVTLTGIVLLAILYPLALTLLNLPSISVGPGYFNRSFLPIAAPLPILAALAPLIAWERTRPGHLADLCKSLMPGAFTGAIIALALFSPRSATLAVGVALGSWLVLGSIRRVAWITGGKLRIAKQLPLATLAGVMAHLGFAVFVLGMTFTACLKERYEAPLRTEKAIEVGDYRLHVIGATRFEKDNFTARRATLDVFRGDIKITTVAPELRYYPARAMQTSEAALYSTPFYDMIVMLGEAEYAREKSEAPLSVQVMIIPAQQWVWGGFLLAALGGLLSLVSTLRNRWRHI